MNQKWRFLSTETWTTFDDFPLFFEAAQEPCAINWENQYVKKHRKTYKSLISTICLIASLICSFALVYYSQKEVNSYLDVYPNINCNEIKMLYKDTLKHYAILEWHYIREM